MHMEGSSSPLSRAAKRACIEYEDGSVFVGFVDEEEDPHGEGMMTDEVGVVWTGLWRKGVMHGKGRCETESTRFVGEFVEGQMVFGETLFSCGGSLIGRLRDGKHCGPDTEFLFPDRKTKLVGVWDENGHMQQGRFSDIVYEFEGAFPGRNPLQKDAYENQYCHVMPSLIAGAGEGLFAKMPLPSGLVICYYWGAVISQEDVNQRPQMMNQNVVLLDAFDHCLDVPAPFDKLDRYCATLGHKANHSKELANCEYVDAYHPRFGVTSALKTLRQIEKGEEILLDYEYIYDLPDWYEQ